ncbi:hypothetical protein [Ralstonia sp. A12]|uniref:hypothetical protein n=1 Tax=Ralstonia sp. A12 TaxID=1217052 RepID=UPI0012ECD7E7|nr:hypothetical protein [Ralstonia sp. A12]
MRAVISMCLGLLVATVAGCIWVPDGGYHGGERHGGYEGDHSESRDHDRDHRY